MADRKLTDLTEKSIGSLLDTDVHYMVDTTDVTDDPAGTSFKTSIAAIASKSNEYTSPANTTDHTDFASAIDQAIKNVATVGTVKINSFNGVSEDKPTLTITTVAANTFSGYSNFEYGTDLNLSTITDFPIMDPNKNDASIWDNTNKKIRENNSVNQPHSWRVILSYSRTSYQKVQVVFRLFNTDTNFEAVHRMYFSEERQAATDTGTEEFELKTFADSNSLSAGRGYFMQIGMYGDNEASIDFTIDSLTRDSLSNSNENTI